MTSVVGGTGVVVVDNPLVEGLDGAQAEASTTRPISRLFLLIVTSSSQSESFCTPILERSGPNDRSEKHYCLRMRRNLFILSLFLLAALTASCSGTEGVIEIEMLDNTFVPEDLAIAVGETVRFTNAGRNPHNAIAVDGSWSTTDAFGNIVMEDGDATDITFDRPGVYTYFCSFHATPTADGYAGMIGTITVSDASAEAAPAEASPGQASDAAASGVTLMVPGDGYLTIQSAVDAAKPGDMILIAGGVYKEQVNVTTDRLIIRGEDRNTVIIDGEFLRENGINIVGANGVAVENLTVRNATGNGVFWNGVVGYRGSYLTSIDNWVYGIYAFDSTDGLLEHSYASGSYDAGFYIGQCDPCNAVVKNVHAEYNGLGFSGTNASVNLYLINSEYNNNIAGVVPNTLDSETLPPVHDVIVAGNYIHDNGELNAPTGKLEWSGYGSGIILAGSVNSQIHNNLVINNAGSGIGIVPMIDVNFWPSQGNVVEDNIVLGSGRADLMLGGPLESGSCFSNNTAETKIPSLLTVLHSCNGLNVNMAFGLAGTSDLLGRVAQAQNGVGTDLEHGDAQKPGPQEQMPGGKDAPVRTATNLFLTTNIETLATPAFVEGTAINDRNLVISGVSLGSGFWPLFFGAILHWIPRLVWGLGALWALLKLRQRDELRPLTRWISIAIVTLVPVLGVMFFALFGWKEKPVGWRVGRVLGYTGVWLVLVIAGLLIGKVV